jgi:hypothetical protein
VIASGSTDWSISAISWIYAHDAAVLERAWPALKAQQARRVRFAARNPSSRGRSRAVPEFFRKQPF